MNRVTVELTPYVPAADLFRLVCHQPDCAFLDSSLVNDLGRWSIIGLKPHVDTVTAHWGKVGLSNYHFPWNRAFEIDMDISVDPLTR